MRKILTLMLALTLVFDFVACGNNNSTESDSNAKTESEQNDDNMTSDTTPDETPDTTPDKTQMRQFDMIGFRFYLNNCEELKTDNGVGYVIQEHSYHSAVEYRESGISHWIIHIVDPFVIINDLQEMEKITFDNIAEVCEEKILDNMINEKHFNSPDKQVIETSEKVLVGDVEMLKVEGYLVNSKDESVKTNYIAYYMIATTQGGTNVPLCYWGYGCNYDTNTGKEISSANEYYDEVKAFIEEHIQYTEYLW